MRIGSSAIQEDSRGLAFTRQPSSRHLSAENLLDALLSRWGPESKQGESWSCVDFGRWMHQTDHLLVATRAHRGTVCQCVPVLVLVCQYVPVCVRQIVASLTFASHPACSTKAAPVLSVRQDSGTSSFSSPNNFQCSPNRNSYKKHDVLRMRIVFV